MVQEARGYPCITEMAAGFGGGIGRKQDICGAISGGVIAIGYKCSLGRNNQKDIAGAARPEVAALYDSFKAEFGTVDCSGLIEYDYSIPGEYEKAHEDPKRKEQCNRYKEYVIRWMLGRDE